MKNEEELESVMRQKDFASLTENEREFVLRTVGSEEEYDALRKIELAVSDSGLRSTLEPRPEILRALRRQMKEVHATSFEWRNVFHFKVPAYVAVLIVLVISSLTFLLRPSPPTKDVSLGRVSLPVTRIDTVFVTKVDTVVRERIVYRQVNLVSAPVKLDPATLAQPKQVPGSGVSMKEKEELNKLLVSGSD